jgi:hypothetical protein
MNRRTFLLGGLATGAVSLLSGIARGSGNELYGRPLRGLSITKLSELVKDPRKHAGRSLAIAGTARPAGQGAIRLEEGDSSILIVSDGTYSLPQDPAGAAARAEGRLAEGPGSDGLKFIASGVQLSR